MLSFAAITAGLLLASCAAGGGSSDTQGYPSDTITIIVPYSAGSSPDLVARGVAQGFEESFDRTVIVENVPGGAAVPGTSRVANSEPDGHTLGLLTTGSQVIAPLISDTGYTWEDFTYIGTAAQRPTMFVVRSDSPYETIEDFFEAARNNPGQLDVGTAGPSTIAHLKLSVLKERYDVPLNQVPFDGGSETIPALLGGNVDAIFADPIDTLVSSVEAGELRALATDAPEGLQSLPDVPSFASLGDYEELSIGIARFYIAGPADIPSEAEQALESALQDALDNPQVIEQIGEPFVPEEFISGDEIRKDLQETHDLYAPIIADTQ